MRRSHYSRRGKERGAPKAERPKHLQVDPLSDSRTRLILAARQLFAEHGFNATSVRDITSAAGVNLAAVTYYFTTKELLYVHVLQSVLGPLAQGIEGIARSSEPAWVRLEWILRAFFDHIRLNPDMPALMMRELSSGREPSGPVVMMMRTILPAVAGVIAQGQQAGEVRAGDPVLLTFSTIAQPIHLYLARGAIAAVAGLDVNDPQVLERIIGHVVVTVRRALEAR